MFIVLYLILTNVYVDSKPAKGTNKHPFDFIDSVLRYNGSAPKPATENVTMIPKFSMLLDNLNRRTNLKMSVFDKMLSDEMLAIKKNIHSKDVTLTPYVNLSAKYIASTPTLEIKQQWPTKASILFTREPNEKAIMNNIKNHHKSKINGSTAKEYFIKLPNISNNIVRHLKNKVIGVRSFTDHVRHDTNHEEKKCTCIKANMHTSCTAHCTALTEKSCTRSTIPLCSRTLYPFIPYFTLTYVSPLLPITTELPVDINHQNHKHHKTKKPDFEYDSEESNENYHQATDEKEKDEERYFKENKYMIDYGHDNHEDDNNNNDNEEEEENINKVDLEKGYLQVDKERLISSIVDDLKVHYNDAVVKDCYCSSWSNIFQTKSLTIHIIILITFFI